MDTSQYGRLCAAVIQRALRDAQAGNQEALAWLASRQAAPFFDYLDFPQSSFLVRSGWLALAEAAIAGPESPHTPCLHDSLAWLREHC